MQNDIIRMASMAGFETKRDMAWVDQWEVTRSLERFAALVRADEREQCSKREQNSKLASMLAKAFVLAEREKCAQLIETYEKAGNMVGAPHFVMVLKDCAAAIRARSNVQQKPQK